MFSLSQGAPADLKSVYIAVMGATGSGKSTFINLVSGSNLMVSDRLESCTKGVEEGASFELDGRTVTLIDTPGFDDTNKSEVEVLKLIADFLGDQYKRDMTLHGVIYLHRITDNRMGGTSKRSFRLFRKLCGESTLRNVVIVTNMWDRITAAEGEAREDELRSDERFFKPALDQDAKMARHDSTISSAQETIRTVLANSPTPLDLQRELIDQNLHVSRTAAGIELQQDLHELAKWFSGELNKLRQEMREAMEERDKRAAEELADEVRKSNAKLAQVQNELSNLQARNVVQLDAEQMWKNMEQGARVATMFRRARGAEDDPDKSSFWSTLGDTTKAVRELCAIFDRYPMSTRLQYMLCRSGYYNVQAQKDPELVEWIQNNFKSVKKMESVLDKAVSKTKKLKRRIWKLW